MSLIWQRGGDRAGTHALVLGVGFFPNLKGQGDALIDELQFVDDVTSPPNNARAVVEWLIEAADRLFPPLASIELLISETDGSSATWPIDADSPPERTDEAIDKATGDQVHQALVDWLGRAEERPDNVALFYGSSHGMQTQEHILLLEDAGAEPLDPWRNMLSLNHLQRNLYAKTNKRSVLFADCCRDLLEEGRDTLDGFTGRRIGSITAAQYARAKSDEDRCVYLLRASPFGASAKATREGLGFFTAALLRCLRGSAGEQRVGFGWCISPETLRRAVQEAGRFGLNIADRDMRPEDEEGHWVGEPILRLEAPPTYPVRIREADPADVGLARIELTHPGLRCHLVREPAIEPRSALCAWVEPNFEPYHASGAINGGRPPDILLEQVAVPVSSTGQDVRLGRQ